MYNEENTEFEVMLMLFRKKIEHACTYCIHGTKIDEEQIL